MYKASAKSEQFTSRSGNDSTKGSRKGFGLLGGGDDPTLHLTDEERLMGHRASLVARLSQLKMEIQIETTTIRAEAVRKGVDFHRALARRDHLKVEYQRVIFELSEVKAKLQTREHLPLSALAIAFMGVCRDNMTKAQFRRYEDEAHKRVSIGNQLPAPLDES